LFRKTISISQNRYRFNVLQTELPHNKWAPRHAWDWSRTKNGTKKYSTPVFCHLSRHRTNKCPFSADKTAQNKNS